MGEVLSYQSNTKPTDYPKVVYIITNTINGKQYIGQSGRPINLRWTEHCRRSHNYPLSNAIRKYGSDCFRLEILDQVSTKAEMDFCEAFYIKMLNTRVPNGYNLTNGGDGVSGWHQPEDVKHRLSEANKGKTLSDLTRKRMSIAHVGKRLSEVVKERIGLGHKGYKPWNTGKRLSEEHRLHISISVRKSIREASQ